MLRLLFLLITSVAMWAQSTGSVRYIVQLEGAPAVFAKDRSARAAEIDSQHSRFAAQLATLRETTMVAGTRTVLNAVIVEAPEGQEAALGSLPGVRRVVKSREMKLLLDHALNNHAIPPAWNETGGWEKQGAGVKIAILDTGIESAHPAFQMPEIPIPDGYPKASSTENLALTNHKIIVARSFDGLTVQDLYGHGTAVAGMAAANGHTSPRGYIMGTAPKAWLGVYRVNRGASGSIYSDVVIRALDAAVEDGMNIVNMSFGSIGTIGSENDVIAEAARNAADHGVLIFLAAGNAGPELMTVDDTAADSKVIAVGSTQNSRTTTSPRVLPPSGASITAVPSSNVGTAQPSSGNLVDVASLDGGTGLACAALPAGSLQNRIPLILRGTCTFADKLANAAQAGAQVAIVYNRADDPSPDGLIEMDVSANPTIPGLFVGSTDGLRLKTELHASEEAYFVVLQFGEAQNDPKQVSSFSSPGPSVDLKIKPDLMATGQTVFVPTQTQNSAGGMYSDTGFVTVNGTSFSSPLVAGAAASLKTMRPGLHLIEYRSLLVNSATRLDKPDGKMLPVMQTGAGSLNLLNALRSTLSVDPVSVAFAPQGSTANTWRQIILRNISTAAKTYSLSIESSDTALPTLSETQITLAPGQLAGPVLIWQTAGLTGGAYQGFVRIDEPVSGVVTRIPYWMAVRSNTPASISFPDYPTDGFPGTQQFILLRVHDAAGLVLRNTTPEVTVASGGGSVVSIEPDVLGAGIWGLIVRLGVAPGPNEFTVKAGNVTRTLSILGDF